MRKTLLLLASMLLIIPSAALAAPQAAVGTIVGPIEAGPYSFGDTVTFEWTLEGLKGTTYPMVYLACWSDVTGEKLYGELSRPINDIEPVTLQLGGGSSPWHVQRDDVNCEASIRHYGGKGQTPYAWVYDTTEFEASGF